MGNSTFLDLVPHPGEHSGGPAVTAFDRVMLPTPSSPARRKPGEQICQLCPLPALRLLSRDSHWLNLTGSQSPRVLIDNIHKDQLQHGLGQKRAKTGSAGLRTRRINTVTTFTLLWDRQKCSRGLSHTNSVYETRQPWEEP